MPNSVTTIAASHTTTSGRLRVPEGEPSAEWTGALRSWPHADLGDFVRPVAAPHPARYRAGGGGRRRSGDRCGGRRLPGRRLLGRGGGVRHADGTPGRGRGAGA